MFNLLKKATVQSETENNVSQFLFLFSYVRIIFSFVLFSATLFLFRPYINIFYPVIFFLWPAYLILNSVILFLTRKPLGKEKNWLLYLQLTGDILTMTLIIHFFGGTQSEQNYLYLIPIISATLISFRATLITTLSSFVAYFLLIYLENIGWLTTITLWQENFQNIPEARIVRFILVSAIVAVSGYFYISRLKQKDEEIIKLKDEFLVRTVHDLRSPLTSVKWALEKYESPEFNNCSPQEIREDALLVKSVVSRVLTLVSDLLTAAKGGRISSVVKKEFVSVKDVVEQILQDAKPLLVKNKIKIKFSSAKDLPLVIANREILKEVFGNLVDNAIKYNNQEGNINIESAVSKKFIKTTVSDTGIGIATGDIPKLFTPYFRARTGKEIEGTGLGLYVVKKLTENIGGKVEVSSILGKGTTFTVYLPIAK